ncbi:threonine ammonia-lyase, biosynthetic [Endozoicomonas sp. SM1973]|uniref:L-threonine dehydratase n=1 Tax=Spartinivicinus marinus TaxID=2994442 RepID=A0A853HWK1_9GAMM|nr:threonine ammonia-lyase, biosynthetic [Spartinivicinus marinus]MCX4027158.1 threonine ammonia-lyase, biosynthetic [Spartinivicinus marinus]NYZ66120.1 threonine ammonia-lyase, biosynthetic [Spartinivicinus marinus]
MLQPYVKKILEAPVYDIAVETPLDHATFLSERLRNSILIKREDLQPVFSFKIRGAYNRVVQLTKAEQQRGVIAASAGNHAQGLALAAQRLGIKAVIVMPQTTPEIKVKAVKSRGADVILHGDAFDQALAYSMQLVEKHGYVYIHPYDDIDTIAGQGTIGMEILRQHSGPIDAIFVPVGGGGLIAGIAAYVKYLRPETQIIGVEYEESACLKAALEAGERVVLPQVGIFADGVAVAQIGQETFEVCKHYVDEVITVTADEICAAIKDIYDDTRSITEPAGALGIAGIKKYVERKQINGQTLLAIDSGANVNFDRLRYISERAELGERREAIIAVTIPEKPGSFKTFCQTLGKRNITEFNYRYYDNKQAHIFVGVQTKPDTDTKEQLVQQLQDAGYPVVDLSDNEMAKLHIRHMVGGHAEAVKDEVVYRFEFPERPGALLNFLNKLGQRWNISMFHYRNHGAAYGRVVVGLQVPSNDREKVPAFLTDIGYHYWEESENPAYQLFLSNQ